jgi:Protein of unknown function (DUF1592)/Protein of unknown function (DUF1588)/Protein of unknown function (DUF1595)/Protein of unknown function (DUF1585)/Protein of unknown function (DUF1587)
VPTPARSPSKPASISGPIDEPGGASADSESAGPLGFRRLTYREYVNTLADLFPGIDFQAPPDTDANGDFGFSQAALLSDDTTQRLLEAGEDIAAKAVANLDPLLGCSVASQGEDICTAQFVDTFGRRVYRRPVEAAEKSELVALAGQLKTGGYALKDRIRVIVTAMLQAPAFLYRWELGTATPQVEGKVIKLGPYEIASRLSYFLWSSGPDDQLLDAAATGKLDTNADIDGQLDRMLASSKFQRTVESFHEQWLSLTSLDGVSKDATLFPQFGATLKTAMHQETLRFVDDLFSQGSGKLSDLFGSSSSFVNADLAKIYGVAGISGVELRKVSLDPTQRAGILTQASFLSTISNPGATNPPRAGHTMIAKFLCQEIPPAPAGAQAAFKPDPALSTRQNFSVLETQGSCKTCHAILNPIGYAFESFDAIGRFRTQEGSNPVDASGELTTTAGVRPFANAVELGGLLASDADAQACVARNWFRFALARLESSDDAYSLSTSFQRFKEASFDVRAFLKAAAASRTIRYRSAEDGEVLQ